MSESTYTLVLRRNYHHSPAVEVTFTLRGCTLADAEPLELLRTAAEFLTSKEWHEAKLIDDGGELLRMIQNQEQSWRR